MAYIEPTFDKVCELCGSRYKGRAKIGKYCSRCRRAPKIVMMQEYRASTKFGLMEHFTIQEWFNLCQAYGFICLCCKKEESFSSLSPDHVVPLSCGGTNKIRNIQPLCITCNNVKNDRAFDYRQTED